MIWTKEKPTQPGVYWNRTVHSEVQCVIVQERKGKLVVNCSGDEDFRNYAGEWAGPIEEPEEQP